MWKEMLSRERVLQRGRCESLSGAQNRDGVLMPDQDAAAAAAAAAAVAMMTQI
jgi:hypothetical protein